MADEKTVEQQIKDTANAPSFAQVDGIAARAQPIPDLIAADKYLTSKANAKKKTSGLKFARFQSQEPC